MVKSRYTYAIFMEAFLIIIAFMQLTIKDTSFVYWSITGTIHIVISFVLLMQCQKKVISIISLYYLSFCLFQFGLPILYAFINDYSYFYVNLFKDNIKIEGAKFSVLSNDITALGLMFGLLLMSKKTVYSPGKMTFNKKFESNKVIVSNAAFGLFLITAVLVLPITGVTALKQLVSSGYRVDSRGVMGESGILRFAQEFFYSSALIVVCFDINKLRKRIVVCLYCIAALIMLMLADRAQGLISLLVLVYYKYSIDNEAKSRRKRFITNLKFVALGFVFLFILVFIAEARRTSGAGSGFSIFSIISNFIRELGFNFTSICFVMELVPSKFSFRYGATYVSAVAKLVPSSFDFLGVFNGPFFESGEMWLYHYNQIHRSFLNFGVGFSLNAEAFFNFSWFGLIVILFMAVIVALLFDEKKKGKWNMYVRLVLMMDLMLLPRRQMSTLLKSLEYSIFFMAVYLLFAIYLFSKKINKEPEG